MLKNTNVYLIESSVNQNSEHELICEKMTTTQSMANVIELENLKEQNNPDLKLITSGPEEIYVTKRINQSLIHKNYKTFNEQKDVDPFQPEKEIQFLKSSKNKIPLLGTSTELKSWASSNRTENKIPPVYDSDKHNTQSSVIVSQKQTQTSHVTSVSGRNEIGQMTSQKSQSLLNDLPGKGKKIILVGNVQ